MGGNLMSDHMTDAEYEASGDVKNAAHEADALERSDAAKVAAVAAVLEAAISEAESRCADCGEPIVRVPRRQIVFHPTMPSFTEWMHEGWMSNDGFWCDGGNTRRAHPSEPRVHVDELTTALGDPDAALERVRAEARAEALRDGALEVGPALTSEVGGHTSTRSVRQWLNLRAEKEARNA